MKIIIPVILLLFLSCNKINYYPDKTFTQIETKFLGHRGGGMYPYTLRQENTLEAAKYGLSKLEGIEVDVQLSKDNTIWISHSALVDTCNKYTPSCFIELYDYEILQIDSIHCSNYKINKLEEVFQFMYENYPDKYITIDMKAWTICSVGSMDILGLLNVMADKIQQLTTKYHLEHQVFIESGTTNLLGYVKKNCKDLETYLNTTGDFERGMQIALEQSYTGISFKYNYDEIITADHVNLIHQKGLKIQLYTLNEEQVIQEGYAIHPDFIQTDNIDYVVRKYGK